jgi:hypothetical protein
MIWRCYVKTAYLCINMFMKMFVRNRGEHLGMQYHLHTPLPNLLAIKLFLGFSNHQEVLCVWVSISEKWQKLHWMFHLHIDLAVLMNVAGIWSAFKINRSGSVFRLPTLGVASLLLRRGWNNYLQSSSEKLNGFLEQGLTSTVAPPSRRCGSIVNHHCIARRAFRNHRQLGLLRLQDLKFTRWLKLIKYFWAIGLISWLKIYIIIWWDPDKGDRDGPWNIGNL